MADGTRRILTHSEIDQMRAFVYGLLLGRPDIMVGDGVSNPMLLLESHDELGAVLAELVMLAETDDVIRHPGCTHGNGAHCTKTPEALHRARAALSAMNEQRTIL